MSTRPPVASNVDKMAKAGINLEDAIKRSRWAHAWDQFGMLAVPLLGTVPLF